MNAWFGFWITIDNVIDLVNFLSIKGWEILFNFNDLGCADILFGNIDQFDVFEIFRDLINLLLRFGVLWDALDMNNFYFLFLLFSDFIGIFVFFFFFFSFG